MTDKEKQELAEKAGRALGLGRKIRRLAEDRVVEALKMRQKNEGADAAEWVTVHPNGPENKGQPCLVDKIANIVLGGLGGKFTGMSIGKAFKKAAGKIFKKSKSKKQPKENSSSENNSSNQSPKGNKSNNSTNGYDLAKVPQVGSKTPLPKGVKGWRGREESGLPKLGDDASAYHALNKFDENSDTGKAAKYLFERYTATLAKTLNGELRKDPSLKNDKFFRDRVKIIDAYFDDPNHRLKNSVKVYRAVSDAPAARKMLKSGLFQDKGYVSTTTSHDTALDFMSDSSEKDRFVFAMSVPKGYKAVSLNDISVHPGEHEILLKRGATGKISHVEKIRNDRGGWDYVGYVNISPD